MKFFLNEHIFEQKQALFGDIQIVTYLIKIIETIFAKGDDIIRKRSLLASINKVYNDLEEEKIAFPDEFAEEKLILSLRKLNNFLNDEQCIEPKLSHNFSYDYLNIYHFSGIYHTEIITYTILSAMFEQKLKYPNEEIYSIYCPNSIKYISIIRIKSNEKATIENFPCLESIEQLNSLWFIESFRQNIKEVFQLSNEKIDDFLSLYQKEYEKFNFSQWKPTHEYFPMKKVAVQILKAYNYKEQIAKIKTYQDRVAINREVGKFIAELNYYQKSDAEKWNYGKDIFETGRGQNKLYLSIDEKTGSFELCNSEGKHQGEYNFEGDKIDKADDKGYHNINIY